LKPNHEPCRMPDMGKVILTPWIAKLKAADDAERQKRELASSRQDLAASLVFSRGGEFFQQLERELRIQAHDCKAIGVFIDVTQGTTGDESWVRLQARAGFPAVRMAWANLFYRSGNDYIRVVRTSDAHNIEEEEDKMRLLVNHENQVAAYYEGQDLTSTEAASAVMKFLVESVRSLLTPATDTQVEID
jgi:hypothetical protein